MTLNILIVIFAIAGFALLIKSMKGYLQDNKQYKKKTSLFFASIFLLIVAIVLCIGHWYL